MEKRQTNCQSNDLPGAPGNQGAEWSAGSRALEKRPLPPELGAAPSAAHRGISARELDSGEGSHLAGALEPGGWTQKSRSWDPEDEVKRGLGCWQRRTLDPTATPGMWGCCCGGTNQNSKQQGRASSSQPPICWLVSPTAPSQQDSDYREERVGRLLA